DAVVFGREMFASVQQIRDLKPYSGEGTSAEWLFHITGMKRPQVVSVPYGTLAALPVVAKRPPRLSYSERQALASPSSPPISKPAYRKQQMNEYSLRDTELPLPKQRGDTKTVSPSQPADASAGSHKSSPTIPQQPEIDTYRLVATTSARIERLLVTRFHAY